MMMPAGVIRVDIHTRGGLFLSVYMYKQQLWKFAGGDVHSNVYIILYKIYKEWSYERFKGGNTYTHMAYSVLYQGNGDTHYIEKYLLGSNAFAFSGRMQKAKVM